MLHENGNGIGLRVERQEEIVITKLCHGAFAHALVSAHLAARFLQILGREIGCHHCCFLHLYDCPQPPPPGVSIVIRSPRRRRALNFPGIGSTEPSRRVMKVFPGAPSAAPDSPHGPRVRRSASKVTSQSVSTSISRTMPSPPRNFPSPPLFGRSEYFFTRRG